MFVWARVSESIKTTQGSTAWCTSPSLPRITLDVPQSLTTVVPGKIHILMIASDVSVERLATRARRLSPIPARHQQRPTLFHAACYNYIYTCWSNSHLFPQHCQASLPSTHRPNPKKAVWINPHKDKYFLVAELQPISKNLTVNMQLSMTLMGLRMAHHFEQKRRHLQ
jgi:hypothetical protein